MDKRSLDKTVRIVAIFGAIFYVLDLVLDAFEISTSIKTLTRLAEFGRFA